MREMMNVLKALGDENRVRTMMALRERELCVCQITELLRLAPSTVSKHMSVLKQARLVASRKDGRWIHYRLASGEASAEARDAIAWLGETLARNAQVKRDEKEIKSILKCDPEELCRKQCRC